MNIFNDIGLAIQDFFTDLNWSYIIIFLSVIYAIKNNHEEFDWFNDIFNKKEKISKFKLWIAGLVIAILFCIFRYTDGIAPLNSVYISGLLRSMIVSIVFYKISNKKISNHLKNEKK